jgi:hypothetical protein
MTAAAEIRLIPKPIYVCLRDLMTTPTITDYERAISPYVSGAAQTCSYCDHLSPLILLEGRHTYITTAIGQIVEGYTQICSQRHRTAATGLFPDETQELVEMKRLLRAAYRIVYGTPGIAFEHGKAGSCLWGDERPNNMKTLCYHMHVHFVPVDIDIRPYIESLLPDFVRVNSVAELKQVRTRVLEAEPYLYFEDTREVGYVYPVDDDVIPRQFLRNCVAQALGVPEKADWIAFPGAALFGRVRAKLLPVLNELAPTILTDYVKPTSS